MCSPDVVLISSERALASRGALYDTVAPEICVEVMTSGNSKLQMTKSRSCIFREAQKNFDFVKRRGGCGFSSPLGNWNPPRECQVFPKRLNFFKVNTNKLLTALVIICCFGSSEMDLLNKRFENQSYLPVFMCHIIH